MGSKCEQCGEWVGHLWIRNNKRICAKCYFGKKYKKWLRKQLKMARK